MMNNLKGENVPGVSVVVPCYNVQTYIERTIQSILKQNYPKIELILVDDGSSDETGNICDKYSNSDSRITVIHKLNGGLSDARNVGIDAANYEYISFIDGDDWIEPDMYYDMINCMIIDDIDVCICRRNIATDFSKRIDNYRTYPKNKVMSTEEALVNLMNYRGFDMSFCDKVFKSSLFDEIRFPLGKTCEDAFTLYKIFAKAKRVLYLDIPYYNYFVRRGSISRNDNVNETIIEASKSQLEFIKEKFPCIQKDAIGNYVFSIISVDYWYAYRNAEWKKRGEYQGICRKLEVSVYGNKNIELLKKIQVFLFVHFHCLFKKLMCATHKKD